AAEYRRAAEFRMALRDFISHSDKAVTRSGLTPQRYLLLLAIKGGGNGDGTTMTQLSDQLRIAQSTVTELVDRAQRAGLVRRAGTKDGRVVAVHLTRLGEQRLESAFREVRDERDQLLVRLERAQKTFADWAG
ncbi:MAG: MarR family winged helix-turn-helix transcriptional regulator, partial [Gaiellales bacterium]